MYAPERFILVGKVGDVNRSGWIKTTVSGNDVLVTFMEDEIVAIELNRKFDKSNSIVLPPEFHPESSNMLDPLLDTPDYDWGEIRRYPVILDGDKILVGINPMA
jgi:hypothetical protein